MSPSRRGLLTSGFALALGSATVLAQQSGNPSGRPSVLPEPDASASELLRQLSVGANASLLLARIPSLRITPIVGGQTSAAVSSMNAAVDILENLTRASLRTLGRPYLRAYLDDPTTSRQVATAMAPVGEPIYTLLVQLGIPVGEFAAAVGYPWILSVMNAGDIVGGLANLSQIQINALRAAVPSLVQNAPQECVVAVAGAALGALGTVAIQVPGYENLALGSAVCGFPLIGVAASLLP